MRNVYAKYIFIRIGNGCDWFNFFFFVSDAYGTHSISPEKWSLAILYNYGNRVIWTRYYIDTLPLAQNGILEICHFLQTTEFVSLPPQRALSFITVCSGHYSRVSGTSSLATWLLSTLKLIFWEKFKLGTVFALNNLVYSKNFTVFSSKRLTFHNVFQLSGFANTKLIWPKVPVSLQQRTS